MKRTGFLLLGMLALAACGTGGSNPLTGGDDDDPTDGTGVPDGAGGLAGTASFTGQINELSYDAATDIVTINNLPFDGPPGEYTNTGVTVLGGFGLYESEETAETGQRKYYAVFRESASGEISAAAAGTGDYANFGFGGSSLSRSRSSIEIPGEGEAVYRGEYAGLRVLEGGAPGEGIEIVSGNAIMEVDFADFDVVGAVEGRIVNRTYYDTNGNRIDTLPTILLGTGQIDENGVVTGSTAATLDSEGETLQSGTWTGLFGGETADELAGVITINGPEVEDSDFDVQETGVFTTID